MNQSVVSHNDSHNSEENQDSTNKREQFGNRFLTNEKNVFDFNAW